MRIRLRHPGGQALLTLQDGATVNDLKTKIAEQAGFTVFELKYGYPPSNLSLECFSGESKLLETEIKFDGEQLIVSRQYSPPSPIQIEGKPQQNRRAAESEYQQSSKTVNGLPSNTTFSFAGNEAAPRGNTNQPVPKREPQSDGQDAPEIPLPAHDSTLVVRIMPDDNSCLFRAFNSAFFGFMDNMHELRSVIAQEIQADPETYSAAVLDESPDDYCRWIQSDDAWGGSIELDILSKHFDIEICSIDVQRLRTDKYNEGRPTRCILVYSGIHYDVMALSPSDPPHKHSVTPPDFDTKVFESADEPILQAAIELCKVLQARHYFTDTAGFSVKCNICGALFKGEKGATEHAMGTGHTNFGEAS